jgi:CDP-glucose 4,6-dehydratase
MFSDFKDKKVLITGHTGFKGSWLTAWMKKLGANVTGISLDPVSSPSMFEKCFINDSINDLRFNICDQNEINQTIIDLKPDYVFHLAAQALVRDSYSDPIKTWNTNVMGTVNILNSLSHLNNKCTAIFITSDKCYDNVEWVWGYRETDRLGGPDPYSASKGGAELAIKSYYKSFFQNQDLIRIASVRAGNVIGGGDWSKDRLVPDCIKAWSSNNCVELRNPHSTRPWQHVLDPLSGYIKLAVHMNNDSKFNGESYNFGPPANQNFSVKELVEGMSQYWEKVQWKDISETVEGPYESGLLKLDCDKAMFDLGWKAALNFDSTVKMTIEWYKSYYENPSNASKITSKQIDLYEEYRKNWMK